MAGALIFVHAEHGIFLVDGGKVHNGFELVLVLGLAALVFAVGGGGRFSLVFRDYGRRSDGEQDDNEETPPGAPANPAGSAKMPEPPAVDTAPVRTRKRQPKASGS